MAADLEPDVARQIARIVGPAMQRSTEKRAEEVAGQSVLAGKTLERFAAKVELDPEHGCWLWTGATQTRGYGSFGFDGRTYLTHRLAFVHLVGPIPDGMTVDHLCRTRRCVNAIQHLQLLSRSDNSAHDWRSLHDRNARRDGARRLSPSANLRMVGVEPGDLPRLDPAVAFLGVRKVAS